MSGSSKDRGNGLGDILCFAGVVVYSPGMIALPQHDGIFEQCFERLPEGAGRSGFVFEHLVNRADDVVTALLLGHQFQSPGVVRQRAVGMHHAAIIRWDELADPLVAMT